MKEILKAFLLPYQKNDLSYFPYQIAYAINAYEAPDFPAAECTNVVIAGLGGSGIAGWIVKQFFYGKASVPIEVISNYDLPAYAGPSTFLILSSYSGNTEETVALARQAYEKGCKTCVITTNGELEQLAKTYSWPVYYAEPGFQPRMALGYSLTYLLLMLGDLFEYPMEDALRKLSDELRDTEYFIARAKAYFQSLEGYLDHKVIAVADSYTFPTGLRFCQQMQENAKTEAFVHEIPEANHNVIESYYGNVQSVFLFLNSGMVQQNAVRFRFLKELLSNYNNPVLEVPLQDHKLPDLLKLIFTLDWVALMMADAKGVNAFEIPNIQTLKKVLAESQQNG